MAFHRWELRPASEVGTCRRTRRLLARARFFAQAEHGRCCFGVLALGSKQHPTWVRQHAYPSVCAPQTLRPPEGFFCPRTCRLRGTADSREGVAFSMSQGRIIVAAPPHTQDVPLPGVLLAPSMAANAGRSGLPALRFSDTSCVWVVAPGLTSTPIPKASPLSVRRGVLDCPSPAGSARQSAGPAPACVSEGTRMR